jgi:hypothetical protein
MHDIPCINTRRKKRNLSNICISKLIDIVGNRKIIYNPSITIHVLVLQGFQKIAKKATICFAIPVCPSAWNNSTPTEGIFIEFDIWELFLKPVEKIHILLKSDRNNKHITLRPVHICDHISLISSQNEKYFRQTL